MFGFGKNKVVIRLTNTGRFGIFKGNTMVRDYARARDARRGASRLGLTIA